MGLLDELRDDIRATLDRDPAARSGLEVVLFYPGFHAREPTGWRTALHQRGVPLLPRGLMHFTRFVTGIEIHPGAAHRRGASFIDHGMGVVIGETAEIGDDCHILQGVTLGGTQHAPHEAPPDARATASPSAPARSSSAPSRLAITRSIGAGSVVVTNVPANATVVGVPGHVVAFHDHSNGAIQRLPDPEWERLNDLDTRVRERRGLDGHLEEHLGVLHEGHHNGANRSLSRLDEPAPPSV